MDILFGFNKCNINDMNTDTNNRWSICFCFVVFFRKFVRTLQTRYAHRDLAWWNEKEKKTKKKQSRIFTLMWNFLKNSSWGRVASFSRFPLSQLHLKNYLNWSGVGKSIFIPLPHPFKSGTWQPCTQNTKTDTNISSTKQIKIQTKALHYTPNGMSCNYLT